MAGLSPRRSARPAGVSDSAVETAGVSPPGGAGSAPDIRPSPLEVLARHPLLVLLAAAACAAVGYLASQAQASEYESTAQLFLVDPNSTLALDIARTTYVDPRRNARTRAEIVLSEPVLRRAAGELGVSVENVRGRVDAVPSSESDIVTITGVADSPEEAARLVRLLQDGYRAETLSRERAPFRRAVASVRSLRLEVERRLQEVRARLAEGPSPAQSQVLEEERQILRDQVQALQDREAALRSNAALLGTGVQLFERPSLPRAPISPIPLRSAVIGALLGVMSSVGLLWWREGKRPPVAHPRAAAAALGAPLLADLPSALPWLPRHGTGRDEAYHRLNYFIDTIVREGGRLVFFTAARTGDLRIAPALQVAGAFSAGGRRVAIVDGDRHRRRLSRHLGASSTRGLSDLDGDPERLLLSRRIAGSPPIGFLPLGRNRSRLVGLQGTHLYHAALTQLATRFDMTVAYGPALVSLAEANPGPVPEARALVVCGPKTPLAALTDLQGRLELHGLPLAGLVFDRSGRLENALRRTLRAAARYLGRERLSSRRRRAETQPPPEEGERGSRVPLPPDSAAARAARRERGN